MSSVCKSRDRPLNLVLGVGNPLRGDDGAGVAVAGALAALCPPGVEVDVHHGEATAILERWQGYRCVTLVDAVCSGAPAGTIHRFDAVHTRLPGGSFKWSTHGLGIVEIVDLAGILDRRPRAIVVYGIEGREFVLGQGLTPAVKEGVGRAVRRIMDELTRRQRQDGLSRRCRALFRGPYPAR